MRRNPDPDLVPGLWWRTRVKRYQTPAAPLPLPERFGPMLAGLSHARILDIGCGAHPCTGTTWPGVRIAMTRADLRADEYYRYWREHGQPAPPEPIARQDMTALTYADDSFDIVYCANALDHCRHPRKALFEFVRVCRPGGWIYLHHRWHEGRRQRYRNQHVWNIDVIPGGDCVVWSPLYDRSEWFRLSQVLPAFTHEVVPVSRHCDIHSQGQKP